MDLSNTYLDWAVHNMQLNGLDGPQHRFVKADALAFLQQWPAEPTWDLAVVDPPTFSNSKSLERDWDVQKDHVTLLRLLLQRMHPGGEVFFSTNFRRFQLAEEDIRGVEVREISRRTVPPDFRDRKIHRAWRMVVRGDAGGKGGAAPRAAGDSSGR